MAYLKETISTPSTNCNPYSLVMECLMNSSQITDHSTIVLSLLHMLGITTSCTWPAAWGIPRATGRQRGLFKHWSRWSANVRTHTKLFCNIVRHHYKMVIAQLSYSLVVRYRPTYLSWRSSCILSGQTSRIWDRRRILTLPTTRRTMTAGAVQLSYHHWNLVLKSGSRTWNVLVWFSSPMTLLDLTWSTARVERCDATVPIWLPNHLAVLLPFHVSPVMTSTRYPPGGHCQYQPHLSLQLRHEQHVPTTLLRLYQPQRLWSPVVLLIAAMVESIRKLNTWICDFLSLMTPMLIMISQSSTLVLLVESRMSRSCGTTRVSGFRF